MSEPLKLWALLFLRLAIVLLAVGLIPLIVVGTILTEISPLVPVMLSVLVAPLGLLCLLVSVILFLAAALRRPRGSS